MTPARSNGKHPGGRPSKYDPSYPKRLLTFFSQRKPYRRTKLGLQANDPPLLFDFAELVKVWPSTLEDWGRAHEEFCRALEWAKAYQRKYLVTCGVLGLTNSAITALELKNNHGYRDKQLDETPNINVSVSVTMVEGMKQVIAHRTSRLTGVLTGNGHADA